MSVRHSSLYRISNLRNPVQRSMGQPNFEVLWKIIFFLYTNLCTDSKIF